MLNPFVGGRAFLKSFMLACNFEPCKSSKSEVYENIAN